MALFRSFPSQFSVGVLVTTSTVNAASTSVLTSTTAADFGFQAALIKTVVDASGPAYLRFDGQIASTSDFPLTTGDTVMDWYNFGTGASGVSICATSTAFKMRIGAWG